MQVTDKVVIVTGASSGIGEATARLLTKKGAKVALVSRNKNKLKSLSWILKDSAVFPADFRDEGQIKKMVKKVYDYFGRIDILINCAGRGYHVPIMQIKSNRYRELFELNVVGPLVAIQSVIPIMRKQKGGMIVNVSSGTSLMTIPGIGAYSSIKRALNALSLTAREEFMGDNIKVVTVYPYITKTNFHNNLFNEDPFDLKEDPKLPPFDPPEFMAERILTGIKTEKAEIFAHRWMKR